MYLHIIIRGAWRVGRAWRGCMGGWGGPALVDNPARACRATPLARREYPTNADAYELLEEAGRGVSATVRVILRHACA